MGFPGCFAFFFVPPFRLALLRGSVLGQAANGVFLSQARGEMSGGLMGDPQGVTVDCLRVLWKVFEAERNRGVFGLFFFGGMSPWSLLLRSLMEIFLFFFFSDLLTNENAKRWWVHPFSSGLPRCFSPSLLCFFLSLPLKRRFSLV